MFSKVLSTIRNQRTGTENCVGLLTTILPASGLPLPVPVPRGDATERARLWQSNISLAGGILLSSRIAVATSYRRAVWKQLQAFLRHAKARRTSEGQALRRSARN